MEKRDNCCLNAKNISEAEKLVLLKMVLDDDSFQQIKNNHRKVNEAFDINMENILMATQGDF